jgi:hypothetical protein
MDLRQPSLIGLAEQTFFGLNLWGEDRHETLRDALLSRPGDCRSR